MACRLTQLEKNSIIKVIEEARQSRMSLLNVLKQDKQHLEAINPDYKSDAAWIKLFYGIVGMTQDIEIYDDILTKCKRNKVVYYGN